MEKLRKANMRQADAKKFAADSASVVESKVEHTEITPQSIERIKSILFDPQVISERHDIEKRQKVTREIAETEKKALAIERTFLVKKERLQYLEEKREELEALKAKKMLVLEQRLETLVTRFKKFFKIKDKLVVAMQTEVEEIEIEMQGLTLQLFELRDELEKLALEQAKLPAPEKMLEAYYEKMETMPLSNEEKRELLRPEVLAELSTEEYIALWRRLNPYFLSHVTRQGFRDHNAMFYHSAGMREFHNGLINILQDQKTLRPPIAVSENLYRRDEKSIQNFLEDWVLQAEDEEEAKERLDLKLNYSLASAPKYPDQTAVHFAAQIVADEYYGGEKGNESFFIFPSDVLASQYDYAFNGGQKSFTEPQTEDKWNDVFVWPSELDNPGISIDAGIVFLPKNTPVDPETGSKYASEIRIIDGKEERVLIEDEKLISTFKEWAENLGDESPVIQALNKYKETDFRGAGEQKICYEAFKDEMIKLGFSEDIAMDIVYYIFERSDLYYAYPKEGQSYFARTAIEILRSVGANWKRAENTITAKEYWEKYFEQHPEQKPKHIVYYDGSPTTAVQKFLIKHNIGKADTSELEGKLLGFDDRHVSDMTKDSRANRGYDELVATAHKIIEEHYRMKK